jgi:TusA-related sulfurtransferase
MGTVSGAKGSTAVATESTAPASSTRSSLGEKFVDALAGLDGKKLEACFQPKARLRALVPSGPQEHQGARVISRVFVAWFEGGETFRLLDSVSERFADRLHLRYRFRQSYRDGTSELVEQDAFCMVDHGRILAMDLVCSGFRPEPVGTDSNVRRFDAGELGCGSGLPQAFREQISAVAIGGTLEVSSRDPSAKEDLPSLARMLGHQVVAVNALPKGGSVIVVRRGR